MSEMEPDMNRLLWIAAKNMYVLEAIISTFGIIANTVLLVATCRSTAPNSKCNFLIGACALFDVAHLFGNYPGITIMIGDGHIDSLTCCALEFVPEIGVYAGCFCFLSIGLDRLISVSLVAFYRNINRRLYLAIHLMAICIFASYAPFLVFKYYEPHRVICSLPQSFHGEGKRIWMRTILVVNILTLVLYALTWRILRCREESSYTKRVFRAIAPVMIFDVGGWLTAVALSKLIHNIDISGQSILVLLKSCGCIVHSVISVKPIIYYNTSTEYRNIIRAMFGFDIAQTVTKSNRNSVMSKQMIDERIHLASSSQNFNLCRMSL